MAELLFLYDLLPGDDFPAAVRCVKESLAVALALYLPLAGRLAYVAETGDVVVDYCSDSDNVGVAFVEAEARGMDLRRLAGDEAHDVLAFHGLVPELDGRVLPAPALSVQATRLGGGGMALGVSVHHAAADGHALARFLDAWASASRDEFARERLSKFAPNLPTVNTRNYDFTHRFKLARRTFYLSADDIQCLKQRINELALAEAKTAGSDIVLPSYSNKPVSTFAALSALGWTAFVHSKGLAPGEDTHLVFLVDLRERLAPPVSDDYLGNCVRGCLASTNDAGELLGKAGFLHAARVIQAAVREMEAAPLAELETWLNRVRRLPITRLANVAASPRYRVYEEADFGFGMPARMEQVSMDRDGEMLVGGKGDGEVQLSVSLHPDCMDAFKAHIHMYSCSGTR
ncbi:hypothetical protein QOZ80_2AG0124070 [Eleusine coracana subsp. coracana]|nr:hypothetical protein QOZ80_2AG0124070 [Eleusine coracana subsp. coracana]